jgi:hypothetical protein
MKWILMAASYGLALCGALLWYSIADAHDHGRPDLDKWYQSLDRPGMGNPWGGNFSCCNKQDCHPTESEYRGNETWARLGIQNDGVWTLVDYVHIPDEKIIRHKDNPTGGPVICHTMAWEGKQFAPSAVTIYCYVPGYEN